MSKEKRRVPKLRFPGFTEDWEQRKLTSFIQRVKGNDGRMDLPTLTISASEGWLNQKDRFSANIAGSEQKNYTLLRQGELSYNHGNSKLAKYGVVYVLKDYKEALVPRVYHSFKVDESYDALFVEYYFSTKRPDRELAKLVSSGARMDGLLNIGYDEFTNISIAVPTFSEQRQIVALLMRFDKFITLHQRKLKHLKLKKKALLQKLFPKNGERYPELRFPGFTDAWEQRKLSDITEIVMGQSPSSKNYTDNPNDNILVQGNADLKDGKVVPRLWTKEITKTIDKDGIILTVRAPVGDVAKTDYKVVLGRGVAGIKGNDYIYQFLQKLQNNRYWVSLSSGSTFESINSNVIKDLIIDIPSIEEQTKISMLLNNVNSIITLHQRKLEHLQLQKKALLQQMFV